MRYSENIDYLISSIIYLGTHSFYWARSPSNMAQELSLSEDRLKLVFEGFPGIFRKSVRTSSGGEHFYSVQARYALREGGSTSDPEQVSYITPLSTDQLKLLIDFVQQSAEAERTGRIALISNTIAVAAAIVAAGAAIATALL